MNQAAARQAVPDQLRGIALLGIILVNVPFMAISGQSYTDASVATGLDRTVAFLVTMLVAAKFYVIFSFLFGYSALFILKDGSKVHRRVYRRRLIALLLLGLAHAFFFFVGDILVTYALLGFALLLLVKRSDRAVWLTALIVYVVAAFWILALAVLTAALTLLDPEAVAAGELALFDGYDAAMADGTFWQAALERLKVYPIIAVQVIFGQGSLAFVAFCLGMLAARHRFLGRLEEFRPWLRRGAIWGLAIGLPLQFACTWFILGPGLPVGLAAEPQSLVASSVLLILAPILSVGYICGLALLSLRFPRLLAPFGRPGQASLTIYLGESVLLCVIFCGWGFGLFGTLGAAAVTAIAIACWAVLAVAMSLWLRRFSQGPLEWLVGRWTKGPLRKEERDRTALNA
jgi:uncharacterized protein